MARRKRDDAWVVDVEARIEKFARDHRRAYSKKKREQSAIFEIGCFLALVDDYKKNGFSLTDHNLDKDGAFRYLTSPSGNPSNFSHIELERDGEKFELRQQVRIRSHLHSDVTFTPDIVVIAHGAKIEQVKDPDYANGLRGMFAVAAAEVLTFHECKSLPGFPELYVSFLGMLTTVHRKPLRRKAAGASDGHMASTLFVGGESSALHVRMIAALQQIYLLNIVTGLHKGNWIFAKRKPPLNRVLGPMALLLA